MTPMVVRILALSVAIAVNAAALITVHAAMTERVEYEALALQEPARIVVVARGHAGAERDIAANQNCASPKSL